MATKTHEKGSSASHDTPSGDGEAGVKQPTLPYASEPFGVYQPLIGWRSQLQHEHLSAALTNRVVTASHVIGGLLSKQDRPHDAIPQVRHLPALDRTGTKLGQSLAENIRKFESADAFHSILNSSIRKILAESESKKGNTATQLRMATPSMTAKATEQDDSEMALASVLHYLGKTAPHVVQQMFRPSVSNLDRSLAGAGIFSASSPARSVFLSPIGILHMFREYFFQLGTFLGPPVGHIWISPGGSVELVEVNVRKTLVERTTESSTETVTKTELDSTDKDELSDAVKDENANDTKLGASVSASGGVGGVFQASGTTSFNLDESRKQAQEHTHKKMREQSAKLSSEVRQNFKATFRTVTETTDTSSRRYVLENKTNRLVSYELSRKMRKVAVQVQDLGKRLCWQLYVDNPGDPLGIGDFVHANGTALDPNLKAPDTKPRPGNQQKTFTASIPFILYQGNDSGATDTYQPYPGDPTRGFFHPKVGKDDIILFKHDIKCPPAPADYVLGQVMALDFHGAQVKWDADITVDIAKEQFTILLTYARFNGASQIPFDVTIAWVPTKESVDRVDQANAQVKLNYDDQVAAAKESAFYTTLRERLKKSSMVQPRPQSDLREEERTLIYRQLVHSLYGAGKDVGAGWNSQDYHIAAEMIRYFFDIDSMLYFVAPDWWRPRTQQLVSKTDPSQYQPTIYGEPAVPDHIAHHGSKIMWFPGHRPYYFITEETAPAPRGASLGWLIQLDGDTRRNAFLNSPWVKAVLPIRPGREREAITFLKRPEAAAMEGLDEPYPYAKGDPVEYQDKTMEQVLLIIADKVAREYEDSLKPVDVDTGLAKSSKALPTETVFAHGYDPLEGGIAFGKKDDPFGVFSEWTEVLPTDQIVATEYSLKGL